MNRNKLFPEPQVGEMMQLFEPMVQLAIAGIQNKMSPKEAAAYFMEMMDEVAKDMGGK